MLTRERLQRKGSRFLLRLSCQHELNYLRPIPGAHGTSVDHGKEASLTVRSRQKQGGRLKTNLCSFWLVLGVVDASRWSPFASV